MKSLVEDCDGKPAADDNIMGLLDGESQLLHVRPVQTDMILFAGQRHQHQPRLLSARHHVTVFCDHHPVSGIMQPILCKK